MSDKQLVLDAVKSMREKASFSEILDELKLLQSVRQGLNETERGQATPHKVLVRRMKTWIGNSARRNEF